MLMHCPLLTLLLSYSISTVDIRSCLYASVVYISRYVLNIIRFNHNVSAASLIIAMILLRKKVHCRIVYCTRILNVK